MDRDATEIPELTDAIIAPSQQGLAVKVLQAQDVDLRDFVSEDVIPPAEVEVIVRADESPPSGVLIVGEIDVPSGVLTLGDAEQEEVVAIGAGRWKVRVECAPSEFAEVVHVWLQRA